MIMDTAAMHTTKLHVYKTDTQNFTPKHLLLFFIEQILHFILLLH